MNYDNDKEISCGGCGLESLFAQLEQGDHHRSTKKKCCKKYKKNKRCKKCPKRP